MTATTKTDCGYEDRSALIADFECGDADIFEIAGKHYFVDYVLTCEGCSKLHASHNHTLNDDWLCEACAEDMACEGVHQSTEAAMYRAGAL